jgi:hypothetical protein
MGSSISTATIKFVNRSNCVIGPRPLAKFRPELVGHVADAERGWFRRLIAARSSYRLPLLTTRHNGYPDPAWRSIGDRQRLPLESVAKVRIVVIRHGSAKFRFEPVAGRHPQP